MDRVRRAVAAAAVLLASLGIWLLAVGPASAETGPVATPVPGPEEGVALAATGFNIMVPVIIGLTTLVVGLALVCWAFLRGGRRPSRHH
ncbi:hypothetical protein GIS00_04105 [Nakamurella sp. YIM 132087]|uniref:LPXTG cell wall anchor domain-containing protein n=1 Tax=Nakamurella alba TaxID=2665158 RepID=A0A7K1FGA3_9ACTN|nr:hypothetical protein [Nakamurella alba]MTD13128.1 hypothetical protein [Nakamurella alba]